ncbi:hypothetical protein HQ584_07035 [Patescibacteria group bacterium]|nr:hypothetical protein [Patescibacteria group bacterium]
MGNNQYPKRKKEAIIKRLRANTDLSVILICLTTIQTTNKIKRYKNNEKKNALFVKPEADINKTKRKGIAVFKEKLFKNL